MARPQRSAARQPLGKPTGSKTAVLALLGAVLLPLSAGAGGADAGVEPGRQLRNLHGFSKLYGFVRFFHPSDEARQIDWEKFAVYGARRVLEAPGAEALRAVLEELFGPLAPSLRIYPTGSAVPRAAPIPSPMMPPTMAMPRPR